MPARLKPGIPVLEFQQSPEDKTDVLKKTNNLVAVGNQRMMIMIVGLSEHCWLAKF